MSIINITIIGLGPRGVTLLERLHAVLPNHPTIRFCIHLIDVNTLGEGIHSSNQPDYLILNTVCSQITLFCDPTVKNAGPPNEGPSLYEWVKQNGWLLTESGELSKTEGRAVEPNDYLPRSIFGKYLNTVCQNFINDLKQFAQVLVYQNMACHIVPTNDNQYMIKLDDDSTVLTDYLFLATGHSVNHPDQRDKYLQELALSEVKQNKSLKYIANPYPISQMPALATREMTVAIEGFGLTAMDILASLTIGLGGKFKTRADSQQLIYHPSHREPKLIIYSLDNLPLNGRAVNQKGTYGQYKAKFLTLAAIDGLRKQSINGQLCFEKDILPLLKNEINCCYYTTLIRSQHDDAKAQQFENNFIAQSKDKAALDALIEMHFQAKDLFNWSVFFNPYTHTKFETPAAFKTWLLQYLQNDLKACYAGNVDGAYKAACDVFRDIRDNIRYAIDFAGLTPASHRLFLTKYMPFMNRVSVGPPKERIAQMLALIDIGLLDMFVGTLPDITMDKTNAKFKILGKGINNNIPRYADVIVKARIHQPFPDIDQSALMQNCLNDGILAPFYNGRFHPGGIRINRDFHPVDARDKTHEQIWAIGTLVEGAKFYTYIVPRRGVNSTGIQDAGKAVLQMITHIEQKYHVKFTRYATV